MVDRAARRQLALLLRRYASGRIDEWELAAALPELATKDTAIGPIMAAMCRQVSEFPDADPVHPYCRNGVRRRVLARWVLFLYGEEEYRWPEMKNWPYQESPASCAIGISVLIAWAVLLAGYVGALRPLGEFNSNVLYGLWTALSMVTWFSVSLAWPWLARRNARRSAKSHGGNIDLWPFHDAEQYARVASRHPWSATSSAPTHP